LQRAKHVTEIIRWWRLLLIGILAVGIAIRAWPWLREPLLLHEDGAVFFSKSYAQLDWNTLISPYAGYLPFGANLSAMLMCRLPTEWIPSAFVAVACAVQLAAGSTLLRRSWTAVAPLWVCGLLAALITLLPISTHFEFTNLAYMQWPMLCWLFLLLIEPQPAAPVSKTRRHIDSVLVLFLTISHPLAVTLAPLGFLPAARNAQPNRWMSFTSALIVYALLVVIVAKPGGQDLSFSLLRSLDCAPALLFRVGLESFVGFHGWQWLVACGSTIAIGAAILCWLAFAALLSLSLRKWSAKTRTFAIACGWLMIAPLAASLLLKDINWHDPWSIRYLWLSRVAFLLIVTICVTTLASRWVALMIALVMAAVLTSSNASYHQHAEDGDTLRLFVNQLQTQEQNDGHRRLIDARLDREGQPPIIIRPQ